MRYVEFKELIVQELVEHPKGFTWVELKDRLDLPNDRPCPTWIQRMEGEIGLTRVRESGRAYVWKVAAEG
jgi:hypothetical protein